MAVKRSDRQVGNFLARIRDGDEEALAGLIHDYEPEIRRAARVRLSPLLRPHLDSVDLVQSVYVALLRGLRDEKVDISSAEQLVALSAEIIRRKVAQLWRRLQHRKKLHSKLVGLRQLAQTLLFSSDAPADPAAVVQHQDQVEQVLKQLDPADRRLIELRLEGYTTAEAARQLAQSADVLRVRLSRLRKKLRQTGVLTDWL